MTATTTKIATAEVSSEQGNLYRCPKCKRRVTVLLENVAVSCSRCGRVMKCVDIRAEEVHRT